MGTIGDWHRDGVTPESGLCSGRGGFRTCDLSRVNQKAPRSRESQNACKGAPTAPGASRRFAPDQAPISADMGPRIGPRRRPLFGTPQPRNVRAGRSASSLEPTQGRSICTRVGTVRVLPTPLAKFGSGFSRGEGRLGRRRPRPRQGRALVATDDVAGGSPITAERKREPLGGRHAWSASQASVRAGLTETTAATRGCRIYRRRPKHARFAATDLSRNPPRSP